jgi:hypothetical protein
MIKFLNEDKAERANRVVANPTKFVNESVEAVALGRVNAEGVAKTDEEKVLAVYKLLGGAVVETSEDSFEETVVAPVKKGKK